MGDLLTSAEAAQRIHVGETVLRRLRQQGLIRYVAITDRKIMYRPEDCDEYLESRLKKAEPCPSTALQNRRTGNMTSRSKVVGFRKHGLRG